MRRVSAGIVSLLLFGAITGALYQGCASRRDLTTTPPPGDLINVGGHRLHIWCTGDPQPGVPPVLFDAGLGGNAFSWPKIAPEVARFTQACVYDRAGMGYSDPGPTPRTSSAIAKEMTALIREAQLPTPVVLVGLSFGGYNTRIVASEHPELTAGLVLVSASHEDQGERYAAAGIPSGRPPDLALKLGPVVASLGLLRMAGVTLGPPPARADRSVRPFVQATAYRSSRYQTMASELENTRVSGKQVASSRRKLSIPVVVVSEGKRQGPRAQINSELQRDIVTLSDRACQVIAAESGHGVGAQPELVIQAIRDVVRASADDVSKPGC